MKIRKSKLRKIIQEEIERDLLESENSSEPEKFMSRREKNDLYQQYADDDDPSNDHLIPADWLAGYNLIKKPLDAAVSALSGEGESAPGETPPEADEQELNEIMAAWALSLKMDIAKGTLDGTTLGDKTKEVISSGYAIVLPVRATFQLVDPEFWSQGNRLPESDLSGCEAMAKIIVAGIMYKAIYKVYESTVGKFDRFLKLRLGRLVGTRRLNIMAALLTPERVKKVLSIAFTMKLLRENEDVKSEVKNLEDEFCKIKNLSTAYEVAERIVIRIGTDSPGFILDALGKLKDELTGSLGNAPSQSQPSPQQGQNQQGQNQQGQSQQSGTSGTPGEEVEVPLEESKIIVRNFKGSGASHVYSDRNSTNLGKNPFLDKSSDSPGDEYSGPVKVSKAFKRLK